MLLGSLEEQPLLAAEVFPVRFDRMQRRPLEQQTLRTLRLPKANREGRWPGGGAGGDSVGAWSLGDGAGVWPLNSDVLRRPRRRRPRRHDDDWRVITRTDFESPDTAVDGGGIWGGGGVGLGVSRGGVGLGVGMAADVDALTELFAALPADHDDDALAEAHAPAASSAASSSSAAFDSAAVALHDRRRQRVGNAEEGHDSEVVRRFLIAAVGVGLAIALLLSRELRFCWASVDASWMSCRKDVVDVASSVVEGLQVFVILGAAYLWFGIRTYCVLHLY
eukprot:TRINITY_DN64311_c0_g1_i1.p1 TRINITY_DN64311_c0_g1~~TRINITY_DN64311_c0_g1_i1.p1  ORF type:complete len:278 (-),score=50.75 TRINITY_DN64311_c0_g1_i1:83-916(-)